MITDASSGGPSKLTVVAQWRGKSSCGKARCVKAEAEAAQVWGKLAAANWTVNLNAFDIDMAVAIMNQDMWVGRLFLGPLKSRVKQIINGASRATDYEGYCDTSYPHHGYSL